MFHPKQSFRASSTRWSHGFYQVRSPRQWTSSRFLPTFVAVEQVTPDLQSKAIFLPLVCWLYPDPGEIANFWTICLHGCCQYLSWVCSVEGAIYACIIFIYPNLIPISTRDRMPTFGRTHILGHWRCRFECLSEETCLPFPACANKALVVGACHCLFSLIISARRMGTGEREVCTQLVGDVLTECQRHKISITGSLSKTSAHCTRSLYKISIRSLLARSLYKISERSLGKISVQVPYKRSLGKICVGAVEMHMDMSQEPFCVEIYRELAGHGWYHLD